MPTLIKKRGRSRYKGVAKMDGELIQEKLFPDDTTASYRAAAIWEEETKRAWMKNQTTPTVYWTLLKWGTDYCTYAQATFVKKVYEEKRDVFKRFLAHPSIDPMAPIDTISRDAAIRYLVDQQTARSGNAANKDRKNLRAAWTHALSYLPEFPQLANPFDVPTRPETRSPRYVPPESDFWAVYDAAQGQDRVMLLAFLHLAGRRGEIFRLRKTDLDFHGRLVRLWTRKRDGGHYEADWIPMTETLHQVLQDWLHTRPVESEYVFVCLDDHEANADRYGQPYQYRQRWMKGLCKRAGVTVFGMHAIRHMTASVLWRDNTPIWQIQAILRHKSPTTTERYLRRMGLLRDVGRALERSLTRKGKLVEVDFSATKKAPAEAAAEA